MALAKWAAGERGKAGAAIVACMAGIKGDSATM